MWQRPLNTRPLAPSTDLSPFNPSTALRPKRLLRFNHNLNRHIFMAPIGSDNDQGATGAAKFITSAVGNTVGGLGRTVGGVVGAGGRGLGQTITSATGSAGKPVGETLETLGNEVEKGAHNVSKGVEDAGKWK